MSTGDRKFADRPHTVRWWDERDALHLPAPLDATFDNLDDALDRATQLIEGTPPWLAWVKVFRSDNEHYEAWRWQHPNPDLWKEHAGRIDRLVDAFRRATRFRTALEMCPRGRPFKRRRLEAAYREALAEANALTGRDPDDESWIEEGVRAAFPPDYHRRLLA